MAMVNGLVVGKHANLTGRRTDGRPSAFKDRCGSGNPSAGRRDADDDAVAARARDPHVELLLARVVEVLELAQNHDRRLEALEAADRRDR
jgi:hypothetical protein